jgi:hypothetical protein
MNSLVKYAVDTFAALPVSYFKPEEQWLPKNIEKVATHIYNLQEGDFFDFFKYVKKEFPEEQSHVAFMQIMNFFTGHNAMLRMSLETENGVVIEMKNLDRKTWSATQDGVTYKSNEIGIKLYRNNLRDIMVRKPSF